MPDIDKTRETLSLHYLNNCGSCFSKSRLEKDHKKLNSKDWEENKAAVIIKKTEKNLLEKRL